MAEEYYKQALLYPQIAIALDPIFRPNPGIIRFSVDILTPGQGHSIELTNTPQKSTGILNDKSIKEIGVNKITTAKYITIKVPREITAYLDGHFAIDIHLGVPGWKTSYFKTETDDTFEQGAYIKENADKYDLNIKQAGGGTSPHTHDGDVTIGGDGKVWTMKGTQKTKTTGKMDGGGGCYLAAVDNTIAKNSRWVIMFIGGDINKPVIISRYYNGDEETPNLMNI